MKLLDPYAVDDDTLTSSNVAETVPAHDPEAEYGTDDEVRLEATHTLYRSLVDANDAPLSDDTKWLNIGPTNRWGMYDRKLGTLTRQYELIDNVITCPGRVSGLAFFRLAAASIQITITDPIDGEVFDQEFDLVNHENVDNFYDYFFAPLLRRRNYFIEGLPLYAGAQVRIRIKNPGAMAECGNCVPGSVIEFGTTTKSASVGIIDYSKKDADPEFGTVDLIERDYRTPANFRDMVKPYLVDEVERVLTERRGKPTVFIGSKKYSSMMIYGFARDWDLAVESGAAVLTAQLESLT